MDLFRNLAGDCQAVKNWRNQVRCHMMICSSLFPVPAHSFQPTLTPALLCWLLAKTRRRRGRLQLMRDRLGAGEWQPQPPRVRVAAHLTSGAARASSGGIPLWCLGMTPSDGLGYNFASITSKVLAWLSRRPAGIFPSCAARASSRGIPLCAWV